MGINKIVKKNLETLQKHINDIAVYDDVFTYDFVSCLYQNAAQSLFLIGWEDSPIMEHREKSFMHSVWPSDLVHKDIISQIKNKDILERIGGRKPWRCILNCTLPGEIYIGHTHSNEDTLLLYLNLEWKSEWFGETEFYAEDLKEIIYTNRYKPNRALWFNGNIPHTIKPQSTEGPKYRFTLSIFYQREACSAHPFTKAKWEMEEKIDKERTKTDYDPMRGYHDKNIEIHKDLDEHTNQLDKKKQEKVDAKETETSR